MTQVSQVMTRGVRAMSPNDTMIKAAQAMEELDVGVIPVCDGDRLVGMVTDRDLVVRGLAQGRAAENTQLNDVMSPEVRWCYDDQSVEEVVEQMRDAQIRRVPVIDHDKHLVGMLSLGDVAVKADEGEAGEALQGISEPAEPDRSGQSQASGAAGGGSSSGKARSGQG
jgi:CBS domain-containing protein